MAGITNHYAASDGDIFSYYLKVLQAGPLIRRTDLGRGTRIRGTSADRMADTYPARVRSLGLDSKWVVENHGVHPDHLMGEPPEAVVKGQDPQLTRPSKK